ncbi:LPS assembly lipoprotein LptE [Labrys monachus]|uniref:LPS-assembly lipoprotein n=1 Tax=Labrys monachus TaxID=217067 RepID=A0ABU0FCT8_9HYPH|nr:LPS assembly lipoprotein LptE [Labrys monachus]MDQ0392422.1 LPS-assembly lipoprotein [Labrys monachus]
MSSPDQTARRTALLALALLPALMLGGCFRPMYATTEGAVAPGLSNKLASITIDQTDDRTTQIIRNKLSFYLTGGGEVPAPRYKLTLVASAFADTALVNSFTSTPEVDTATVTCDFTLRDAATGKVLFKAKGNARKSYDRGLQRYAAVRAEKDAEAAAADVLADQIRTRLAIFLADHPQGAPTAAQ